MNKEELIRKIMGGLRESLNESKSLDLKTNKDHKAAYNSFVKWYNRWKEKLGREEIRALVKKVSNDALGDNLDMINEAYNATKLIENPNTGKLPKVDIDDNEIYDEATNKTIATMNIVNHGALSKSCIIKFKSGLSLQDKLNYRDAILKDRALKRQYNIQKSSFSANHPELFESLNETGYNINLDDGTTIYHSDPTSQIEDLKANGKVWVAIKGTNDRATKIFQQDNQEFLATCKKLGLQVSGNTERKDANGNIHKLYTLNESRVPARIEDANQHLAFDIFLTYENTREIYDNFITPLADNLLRRLRKGQELSFDALVNSSILEKHAKAAIDEYKRTVGRVMVDTATRKALKAKIAEYLINLANDDYSFELHDMESNLHK